MKIEEFLKELLQERNYEEIWLKEGLVKVVVKFKSRASMREAQRSLNKETRGDFGKKKDQEKETVRWGTNHLNHELIFKEPLLYEGISYVPPWNTKEEFILFLYEFKFPPSFLVRIGTDSFSIWFKDLSGDAGYLYTQFFTKKNLAFLNNAKFSNCAFLHIENT